MNAYPVLYTQMPSKVGRGAPALSCICVYVLLLFPCFVWGNSFSASFSLSSPTITLTESLEVTLTLTYPQDYQIERAILRDHLLQAPFTLVKEQQFDPGVVNDLQTQDIRYTLEPQALGTQWISFYDIPFTPKAGGPNKRVTVHSSLLPVQVISGKTQQSILREAGLLPLTLKPIPELDPASILLLKELESLEPERNLRLSHARIFPWHLVALAAILSVVTFGLIYAFYRYHQKITPQAPSPQPASAAFHSLDLLEARHLSTKKQYNEYYTELTQIIRHFIERETAIQAEEKTTPEFLAIVAKKPQFTPESRQLLADLLSYADQVKFARQDSSASDCLLAISYAREFIRLISEKN